MVIISSLFKTKKLQVCYNEPYLKIHNYQIKQTLDFLGEIKN